MELKPLISPIATSENLTLVLGLFYFLARPFIVWIHELGHAVPMTFLSKKDVHIYIGSYGDPTESITFKIGPFDFFVKKHPFLWNKGVCISQSQDIAVDHQLIYILLGPVTVLLAGILVFTASELFIFSRYLSTFCLAFLIGSIIDVLFNLIPRSKPFKMYDGTLNYNDGQSLRVLWQYRKYPEAYKIGASAYQNQHYAQAAETFNQLLLLFPKDKNIFRLTLSSYLFSGDYEKAKSLHDTFENLFKLDADDYAIAGLLHSKLQQYHKALYYYDENLKIEPLNKMTLNNKGYTLNLLKQYNDALLLFDKAIELESTYAYSYNNRGLSKLKLGFVEDGLKDITYSLSLNDSNAYAYLNLGIYHLDKKEYTEALQLFIKAKNLDAQTHLIDDFILQAQTKLNAF